jgi:uncharacterized protein YbaP (TraB family)
MSYILGTIHGGVALAELPPFVLERFNSAKTFVNEWRFSDEQVDGILSGHLVDIQLKLFKFAGDPLTNEQKKSLIVDWAVDARLAVQARSHDCSLVSFGGPFKTGFMDFELQSMAQKKRLNIVSLDSALLYQTIHREHPESVDTCDLTEVMKSNSPELMFAAQEKMISIYRSGTPIVDNDEETSLRNAAWFPVLKSQIDSGPCFIAVGEAHLFGPKGLLQLLDDTGYVVTPIN